MKSEPRLVQVEDLVVRLTFRTGETVVKTLEGGTLVIDTDKESRARYREMMKDFYGRDGGPMIPHLRIEVSNGESRLAAFLKQEFFESSPNRRLSRYAIQSVDTVGRPVRWVPDPQVEVERTLNAFEAELAEWKASQLKPLDKGLSPEAVDKFCHPENDTSHSCQSADTHDEAADGLPFWHWLLGSLIVFGSLCWFF